MRRALQTRSSRLGSFTQALALAAVALTAALVTPTTSYAQAAKPAVSDAKTLDELLERTRTARARDAKVNADRIARFKAARDEQAGLLAKAEADKNAAEAESATLGKEFEANEKALTELHDSLKIKVGNLGELFGVLRQTAGDFSSVARNSLISAQYKDRIAKIDELAQTKSMPPMEDLEGFWFEMQREMTETGKITRFKAPVASAGGIESEQTVTRIGPFVAIAGGNYLEFKPGVNTLAVPPKQPEGDYAKLAKNFGEASGGYQHMVIDPTRGVILSLLSQRPGLADRIAVGGWEAKLILSVGAIGALAAVFQFFYLNFVGIKVNAQLRNLKKLSLDNPLGRVLLAFKGDKAPAAGEEAEVVELRISEAVLKELPPIERFQSLVKLVVAAGPLLGLVGTVLGMIETFQSITESGSSDPKLMAAGIGKAMIATVLGLGVAIPLLFINSALASRSKRIIQILDEQSTGLLAEMLEARIGAGHGTAPASAPAAPVGAAPRRGKVPSFLASEKGSDDGAAGEPAGV